jgi:Fe-S-cluster containining protein
VAAFCLDIHARYQCRHTGACCKSWSVPAEPHVVALVRERNLRRAGVAGDLFISAFGRDVEKNWTVARDERGECVFFDRKAGRLCVIHREVGPDALPSACRHFPRKLLIDQRGTLISLSHFCPTAAAALLTSASLSIVEASPPLRLPPPVEGLDAREALPPLLRPGLLCDIQGYDVWERAALAVFARTTIDFGTCLDIVSAATESIRHWSPGGESLADRVRSDFHSADAAHTRYSRSPARAIERIRLLTMGGVGDDLAPLDSFDDRWKECAARRLDWFNVAMKNYLAARLFANWIAYQGQGLRTIVEWLRTCAAVVGHELLRHTRDAESIPDTSAFIEAVRSADLILLHVLDSASFAKQAVRIEEF